MFSACWVAQDYSHRTPGRAQSCQERPRNIIFRPNRWRRRAPPPPHHQITSRARRTTSSAPYSPVPFLRSDSVLRLQATRDLELPFSLSLSRPRVRLPPRDTARSVRRGGGGGRSRVGGGRGWPPRTAAAAATRRGTQRPRRRCGTLHLRRELAAAIWRRTSGSSAASACELRRAFSLFFFSAHVVVTFAGVWADDPLSLIGRSCCVITRPRFWSSAIRRLFSSLIFSFLHRFYALYIAPFLNFCVVILSLDIVNVRSPSRNTGDEL